MYLSRFLVVGIEIFNLQDSKFLTMQFFALAQVPLNLADIVAFADIDDV